ncbi:MAG: hypothetical protein QOF87_4248, partial [Pseudonocardiales bacterium]|nr:hypothetical protein [Pseudonocardiales bacterium]
MSKNLLVAALAAALVSQMTVAPALAVPVRGGGGHAAAAPVSAAPISPTDPTKVPHYFGPYPNWANSPQVLSNAVVGITGGGGTGAAANATVDPKTGGVTGYTVTNPGTGYTTAPTVDITSPGVTTAAGAAATAVISPGVVTSIAVAEAGFGFTTPSVAIVGGGAPSAVAAAQASGGVDDLTIT